jgi:hypothetical protein
MTKTTKSERKWGKKEPTEEEVNPRKSTSKDIEMYKILVDGSGFTKAMSYEDCKKFIRTKENNAKRLNMGAPSLVMVKQ